MNLKYVISYENDPNDPIGNLKTLYHLTTNISVVFFTFINLSIHSK